ncbi:MAG: hypothetical protein Nk1A_5730 [Endomicrobiia bacterium]|nr:MAG: hypothetical protein Nk1A_5730 [Endomicrobiia bacterium]
MKKIALAMVLVFALGSIKPVRAVSFEEYIGPPLGLFAICAVDFAFALVMHYYNLTKPKPSKKYYDPLVIPIIPPIRHLI